MSQDGEVSLKEDLQELLACAAAIRRKALLLCRDQVAENLRCKAT